MGFGRCVVVGGVGWGGGGEGVCVGVVCVVVWGGVGVVRGGGEGRGVSEGGWVGVWGCGMWWVWGGVGRGVRVGV